MTVMPGRRVAEVFPDFRAVVSTPLAAAGDVAAEHVVPEVDRLTVSVVTDSYHHSMEPSGRFGDVEVRRHRTPPSPEVPRTLQNEWGLALHVASQRGDETRRVLIDFGYTSSTLNNNLDLMGIDPGSLDALVLSHGHYDHFGGMAGFLDEHGAALRPNLPFHVGGEECFCRRDAGPIDTPYFFGALDRRALVDAGLQTSFAERPSLVADHGFTTGTIPLASFESPAHPTRMTVGLDAGGCGCDPAGLGSHLADGDRVVDDFVHEQATCFHVRGKGLVVITSCGHRGVVNSTLAAMEVSGIDRIHAIVGGFHLAPMPGDYVDATIDALRELRPAHVIPMHCSGPTFHERAKIAFGDALLLSSTGTHFTFGA